MVIGFHGRRVAIESPRAAVGLLALAVLAGACRQSTRPDSGTVASGSKVEQRQSALTALSRTGWTASASTGASASNAIDGSATTRWTTTSNQVANQWFQVDMAVQRTFTELRLDTATTPNDFPRNYSVTTSDNGTTWSSAIATGVGAGAVVTIPFASQTARFVRVTLTAGAAAPWSIYELNVYDTAQARTGWVATASVNSANAPLAIDATAATRWNTGTTQTTGQFLQVDMTSAQTFSQITLDTGNITPVPFPRGYSVTTSNDGTTWSAAIATGTGANRLTVINFATQQARFVRITLTMTNSTPWSVEELNVNGQPTGPITYPRIGWVATGSANTTGNVPANAIDGSATTRWTTSTAQASGQFFQVDMGTFRTFTQVTLDAGTTTNNFPRSWQLQTSNNGTTWATVTSGTGSAALVTINVPAQTARFIKINLTAANTNPWSIQELNVSGPALTQPGWVATGSANSTGNVPANAVDGSATTRWSTTGAQTNTFFTVDMGTAQVFNQLTLDAGTTPNNFPRNYSVFVSNDGTNWGTAVATGTGTGQLVTINFLTRTARFFKIQTPTTPADSNTWSIQELNVARITQPCDSITCTASDQCHTAGVCDPNTGVCSNPNASNGTNCNDANACTTGETCTNGTCTGGSTVTCTADQCHNAGTCVPATGCPAPTNKTDGTTCNDTNACTQTDKCMAGVCTGTNPVVCTASDQCHVAGVCNTGTGVCSNPTKADNTTCNDTNACTQTDKCVAGVCTGTTPVVCTATDQCHAVGVCNTGTGVCSNPPKADNTTCNDTNACTQTDKCVAGVCTGTNPVVCTASDQCHVAGVCNTGTGVCSNPTKADNSTCNDSNACTNGETCQGGSCTGGTAVTCTADQCHNAGTCVPQTGCPTGPNKGDGTPCNDANACTQTDTCQSGTCVGGNPIVCAASDQCHSGVSTCNTATGVCSGISKVADGTLCDDGNRCSVGDACSKGTCIPGTTNACTAAGDAKYARVIDLGSAQGYSYASSINESGVVVGTDTVNGDLAQLGYVGSRGFHWSENEGLVPLPWSGMASYAEDINESGVMSVTAGVGPGERGPCRYDPRVDSQPVCQPSAGVAGGINDSGTIAGGVYLPGTGTPRMFRLGTGAIEILPSAPNSNPNNLMAAGGGITADGSVFGSQYIDGKWLPIRYTDAHGSQLISELLPPGTDWVVAAASSVRAGEMLGWGSRSQRPRALRMKTNPAGDITEIFDLPMPQPYAADAANVMAASSSNASNEIVGTVYDDLPYWPQTAYVYTDATGSVDLNTLIDPGSGWQLKSASATNDRHEVVGYGIHNGVQRAYKLTLPDLSPCPPSTDTCRQGTGVRDPLTGVCSYAPKPNGTACNDGQVCTQSETCQAGICQPPVPTFPVVVNLPIEYLGSFGPQSFPYDINASGTSVGWASTPDLQNHAWRADGPGTITNLAAELNLGSPSSAQAINDSNTIVGFETFGGVSKVFRYGAAGFKDDFDDLSDGTPALNEESYVLHAGIYVTGSFPTEINNAGDIVGFYTAGNKYRGFRVRDNMPPEDVPPLVPGGSTVLYGISERGTVVGNGSLTTTDFGPTHAVLYDNEIVGLVDLNTIIPGSGWELLSATSINGDYVVGAGVHNGDGVYRPYRLHLSPDLSSGVVDDISGGWYSSGASKVNAAGDTVGAGAVTYEEATTSHWAAFVFTDQLGFKNIADIIPQDFSWYLANPASINDSGQIIGWGYYTGGWGPGPWRVKLPAGQAATCEARNVCGGAGGAVCLYSDGVVDLGDGHYVAVFGYASSSGASFHPATNEVRLDGTLVSNPNPPPPQWFASGTHSATFLPTFNAGQTISWTVDGQTATASAAASTRLPKVPIGATGYGVMIGGRLYTLKPDVPEEPTVQNDPPTGAAFPGVVSGELNIGPSGAAVYKVPIAIPPGIAGMAPNLNLTYNSQLGNGIAGQGWQLGGISMIHRCSKSRLKDGEARPIEMSGWTEVDPRSGDVDPRNAGGEFDGLCLDGQRLFERESGRYEPENQDFSEITRSSDYKTFKVVTKSGETRYYGSSTKSRVSFNDYDGDHRFSMVQQDAIWALDRVEDVWGNYYSIIYNNGLEDWQQTGIIITEIDYTGHHGASRNDDQPAFHTITFGYESRPDVRTARFRHSRLPMPLRLSSITTPAGKYWLTYLPDDDPMLPSRLGGIDYCAGSSCPVDLPATTFLKMQAGFAMPLTFNWDGGEYAWEESTDYKLPRSVGAINGTQFVDLNGDGRPDFVQSVSGHPEFSSAWKNNGHGWTTKENWSLPEGLIDGISQNVSMIFADMDGDGLVDIVSSNPEGPPVRVWYNRIKGNENCATAQCWELHDAALPAGYGRPIFVQAHVNAPPPTHFVVDMDGDGRPDILGYERTVNPPHAGVLLNKPSGWVPAFSLGGEGRPRDLNRDGLADLVWGGGVDNNGQPIAVSCAINLGPEHRACPTCTPNAFGRPQTPCGYPIDRSTLTTADVDGDGLLDNTSMTFRKVVPGPVGDDGQCPPTPVRRYRATTAFSFGDDMATDDVGDEYKSHDPGDLFPMNTDLCADRNTYYTAMADINADGLADLILAHPAQPNTDQEHPGQLLVNRGSRWQDLNGATTFQRYISGPNIVPRVPTDNGGAGSVYLDLDGDGVTDIVQAGPGGSQLTQAPNAKSWLNKFRPPVIKKFPNGLAGPTTVLYQVITTAEAQLPGAVYVETNDRDAGTTFFMTPLRVVSGVFKDDGLGHGTTRLTTYQYESLRGNPLGWGPQGFRRVTVNESEVDDTFASKTVTTYLQLPPYTGLPKTVERYRIYLGFVPVLLTRTDNEYCDTILEVGGTPQCEPVTGPGTSKFVYPVKVTDTANLFSDYTAVGDITTVTDFRYDKRGNSVRNTVTTTKTETDLSTGQPLPTEMHIKETINSYGEVDSTQQKMGKLTKSIVTTRQVGGLSSTHETRFEYGVVSTFTPPGGAATPTLAMTKKLVEPGKDVPIELHTAYGYDAFGNVTVTTDCASDFTSCAAGVVNPTPPGPAHPPFRTTTTSFDPGDFTPPPPSAPGAIASLGYTNKGRFLVKSTNLLSQSEYYAYDPLLGLQLQRTDPNGINTRRFFDPYGRQTGEVARAGSSSPISTEIARNFVATGDPAPAATVTVTTPQTGETTWTYADAFGRTVATRTRSFDGGFVKTRTEYDALGRTVKVTKPFPESAGPSFYTLTHYDGFGRVDDITDDLGVLDDTGTQRFGKVTTKFQGSTVLTKRKVGSDEQPRWETKNAIGQTIVVRDAAQTRMVFQYDADGNLTDAGDPWNHMLPTVHVDFDARGRKMAALDPDMGVSSYIYDGFGELIEQTDAKGQKTRLEYDALGRLVRKTELADTPQASTGEWVYGSDPGVIGKLLAVVSAPDDKLKASCTIPHATLMDGKRTGRSYTYTALGEIEEVAECADGETFATGFQYDSSGRQSLVRYPRVAGKRLEVEYHYTSTGFLHYLRDPSEDVVLWAGTERNALGKVTREYTRNGVETVAARNPATGWLMSATSVAHADGDTLIQSASYRFDELGNLRFRGREDATSPVVTMEDFGYDALNRVTSAHMQTTGGYNATSFYGYDPIGNMAAKDGKAYSYIGCGGRPHAVCAVDNGTPFVYDLSGNMTSGNSRTIDYNALNKPSHIDSHPSVSQGNDTGVADFIYGPEGDRVIQSIGTYPNTELARTVYVGLGATGKSLYERTTRGTTVEHSHFIYAGNAHNGNAFALRVVTEVPATGPIEATKYFHLDHLGSVTAMSDEQGHVVSDGPDAQAMAYDSWGARRNLDGTPANPASFNLQTGHREFTGHETIPNVGLVNMNGRVYDPLLGRFLSADPNVQVAADLQSYNRYSYVLNNPLRYTDPTGYFVDGGAFDLFLTVSVAAVAAFMCPETGGGGCAAAVALFTAAYMAASAANAGASDGQIAQQFLVSFLASEVGGVFGSAAGAAFSNPVVGAIISGAVSGAVSSTMNAVITNGEISGWNILASAALGAAMASVAWGGAQSRALSQASLEESSEGFAAATTATQGIKDYTSERSLVNSSEEQTIAAVHKRTTGVIADTIEALNRWDDADRAVFKHWFHTDSEIAREHVLEGFLRVQRIHQMVKVDSDFFVNTKNTHDYAYTDETGPLHITLTKGFFSLDTGRQVAILIHEYTHLWSTFASDGDRAMSAFDYKKALKLPAVKALGNPVNLSIYAACNTMAISGGCTN